MYVCLCVCLFTIMGALWYFPFYVFLFYFIYKTAGYNPLSLFHDSLMGLDSQFEKCELISIRMFLVTTKLFLSCSIKYLNEDRRNVFKFAWKNVIFLYEIINSLKLNRKLESWQVLEVILKHNEVLPPSLRTWGIRRKDRIAVRFTSKWKYISRNSKNHIATNREFQWIHSGFSLKVRE